MCVQCALVDVPYVLPSCGISLLIKLVSYNFYYFNLLCIIKKLASPVVSKNKQCVYAVYVCSDFNLKNV